MELARPGKAGKPLRFQYRFSFFLVNCAIGALLVLFLWLAYDLYKRAAESDQWVIHTNDVLNNIRDVNIYARAIEATNRGYILSKNPVFKEDYQLATARIEKAIGNLYELTHTDNSQKQRLDTLNDLVHKKITVTRNKIAAADSGTLARIDAIPPYSLALSRSIQQYIDKFQKAENDLLNQRTERNRKLSKERLLFTLGSFLLVLVFLAITVYNISINIRRRAKAEDMARLQEERYRVLIERSGVALAAIDHQSQFIFASQSFENLTGYKQEDLKKIDSSRIIPFEFTALQHDAEKPGAIWRDKTIDFKLAKKDGTERWVSGRIFPVTISEDEARREWQLVLWDIDEEKKMKLDLESLEAESKEQQKLVQDIIDNIPLVVYIKDTKGRYRIINNKMLDVLHISSNTILGKTDRHLDLSEDKLKLYTDTDDIVLRQKTTTSIEDEVTIDGQKHYFWVTKLPLLDEKGSVKYICGIAADVTIFKEVEYKLIQARDEAESAKAAQESFLANISHEIRTPMNGIIGMSNLLTETNLDHPQREYTESIQESARNLLSLINDLLDISKIRSGKFKFESLPFSITECIKKAVYPLKFKATEKAIDLDIKLDSRLNDRVVGDQLRLQQIVINLTNNAIKFTSKGSVEVRVRTELVEGEDIMLHVDVVDTGIGIPEDKLGDVFDSYSQSNFSIARLYGGTGLGLAIVKQLVEMQHGTVSVSSVAGKGSIFAFNIPYKLSDGKEIADSVGKMGQTAMIKGVRVLVAEDNAINQKVVSYTLQNKGAEVTVVNNGREAVEAVQSATYDVVLMDMQMPEMDGYEATTYIRKELQMTELPVIAMTANALKGEAEKCFEAGVSSFISKPFSQQELIQEIVSLTAPGGMMMTDGATHRAEMDGAAEDGVPLLDLSYVRELAGDKGDYINQVLTIFMENTPPGIKELERLITTTMEWDKISKQAHFLKSSVTIVKIKGLHERLQKIEALAREQKDFDVIRRTIGEITVIFAKAEQLIIAEMQETA